MVYNPGFWDNDWSCDDKLWARKSGQYTIHRLKSALDHSECIGKFVENINF